MFKKELNKENIKTNHKLNVAVITLSDRASKGIYEDLSGKYICETLSKYLEENNWQFEIDYSLMPDDADLLRSKLLIYKEKQFDIIFTTGGTGVGLRDITPEVVKPLLDKEIPGIMELIRVKHGMTIPNAVLSRGVCGFMGTSQVYTLPGSVKAVKDYMYEIQKTLEHLIFMYWGIDSH